MDLGSRRTRAFLFGDAMMTVRRLSHLCLWAALLFATAVPILPPSTTAWAVEPVRIGLTLGLTGKYAKLCLMQQRAYALWQDHVNEKGGLLGRPVRVVVFDDESDPESAVRIYRQMIRVDQVDLVFGPYSSTITSAVAPIVEEAGYPMLAAGAADDAIWQKGFKNVFGVFMPASRYAVGMLKLALLYDLSTVAIAYASDPFSVTAGEGSRKWAAKLGLDVVMFERFRKGQRDLRNLAQKAKNADAALLLVTGHFDESVDMRRALKKVGWYPRAYFATIGPVLASYKDQLSGDAELTFANSFWEPELNYPDSRRFAASFRARHDVTPSYQAADAYAAGQILVAAIQAAQSLDRIKIREALQDLRTQTVIGRYGVDPRGAQVKHFGLTIQWQGGAKRIVWPEELKTAQPIFK